mgnify:CR=1 FL=1
MVADDQIRARLKKIKKHNKINRRKTEKKIKEYINGFSNCKRQRNQT